MTTVDLAPVYSQPSVYGGAAGRVHHGYSTAPTDLIDAARHMTGFHLLPAEAWYAKLDPRGFIVPHVDQGPWRERWHYPISGVGEVWQQWDDSDEPYASSVRYDTPYRMNHHQPHAVWNPTDEPRIVLIVEFDNPVEQPTTDLIISPMIPEVQEMIDAL